MTQVTGVVEAAGVDKYGKNYIKVDGAFFGSKYPIPCTKGDNITFDSGTTGKYCNKVQKVAGNTPTEQSVPNSKPAQAGARYESNDSRQGSIESQNALTNTVNLVTKILDNKTALAQTFNFFNINKDEDKNIPVLTIYIHKFFKEIINGDISVDKLNINNPDVKLSEEIPF